MTAALGVECHDVVVTYGRTRALDAVSFCLRPGLTGLLGENGAGKSTLLRVLSGAMNPRSGSVHVGGGQQRVALMPQTPEAPASLTVLEFVTYVTWLRQVPWREARGRAREALAQVGLSKAEDQRTRTLSGGMSRRMWLAQALAARPQVLLLDEPSTGLDPRQRDRMLAILSRLDTTCVLMSSHIIEDVAALASHVLVLDEGRLVYDGATPEHLDARWFLDRVGQRE